MKEEVSIGDLVFLTQAYENYVYKRNPDLRVGLVNRIAKLENIIDWESNRGKKIKQARLKTGKWKDLPLEDSKYIFSIYYHDLIGRKGQRGVIERGVCMFSKDPESGELFFEKIPYWIYKEIQKKSLDFEVEDVSGNIDE